MYWPGSDICKNFGTHLPVDLKNAQLDGSLGYSTILERICSQLTYNWWAFVSKLRTLIAKISTVLSMCALAPKTVNLSNWPKHCARRKLQCSAGSRKMGSVLTLYPVLCSWVNFEWYNFIRASWRDVYVAWWPWNVFIKRHCSREFASSKTYWVFLFRGEEINQVRNSHRDAAWMIRFWKTN